MNAYTKIVDNGVNVGALLGAKEQLTKAPQAAQFTWRATCDWVKGTHSRSEVEGFFGLGEEQQHKTKEKFNGDNHVRHRRRSLQPSPAQTQHDSQATTTKARHDNK